MKTRRWLPPYRSGKAAALKGLMGKAMSATKRAGQSDALQEIFLEELAH